MNSPAPLALPPDHPIYCPDKFFIDTPMVNAVHQKILDWLWCGRTGGVIIGDARLGKTTAIQRIITSLRTRTGDAIPSVFVSIASRDRKTIAAVFKNIWFSVHDVSRTRATADEMCADLVCTFSDLSSINPQRRIVLVIDEAQYLSIDQLTPLIELGNKLRAIGTSLFVLLVGNSYETEPTLKRIQEAPELEMFRGRFFNDVESFWGIRTKTELRKCMALYRQYCAPGEKTSIGDYIIPMGASEEWALESLADVVWDIYDEAYRGPLKMTSWGMQYFCAAMTTLTLDYLPKYSIENLDDVETMVAYSLEASGLPRKRAA